jgi:hypothetical protein
MPLTAHEDCVVIVIDAQPGFHPADLPERDKANARQALDRAAWLVALATHLQVPVVVTEEEPERNGPTDHRLAVAPALTKPTFGLAGTPAILDAVQATGRSTAVLVGFETDVCVYQSAVGLLNERTAVIVVEKRHVLPRRDARPRPRPPARRRRPPHPRQGTGLRVGPDRRAQHRTAEFRRARSGPVPAVTHLLLAFT